MDRGKTEKCEVNRAKMVFFICMMALSIRAGLQELKASERLLQEDGSVQTLQTLQNPVWVDHFQDPQYFESDSGFKQALIRLFATCSYIFAQFVSSLLEL